MLSILLLIIRRNYSASCIVQIIASLLLVIVGIISNVDPATRARCEIITINHVFKILGRSLVVDVNLKNFIVLLYTFLGAWSAALLIFKVKSRVVPFGLAFVALTISALAVEPFLYSALIIEIAVIVSVIMIADPDIPLNKGLLRYLIYFSIGMPFVLLAGWYLAGGEITPVSESQLIQATLLFGLGFVFWISVFPFYTWQPMVAEENRLSESMLLLIVLPVVIIMLLLKYLNGFVWLREYEVTYQALRLFGLIMVITGALWAYFQKDFKRILSYLLITCAGEMLIAISLNLPLGVYLSADFVFPRFCAFFLISWVCIFLEKQGKNMSLNKMKSLFFESPLLATAILSSLFSISCMPLSISFPIMQTLFGYLSADNMLVFILTIFSALVILLVNVKICFLFISKEEREHQNPPPLSLLEKLFFGIFTIFILISGIFPNLYLSWFEKLVAGYQFLVK